MNSPCFPSSLLQASGAHALIHVCASHWDELGWPLMVDPKTVSSLAAAVGAAGSGVQLACLACGVQRGAWGMLIDPCVWMIDVS